MSVSFIKSYCHHIQVTFQEVAVKPWDGNCLKWLTPKACAGFLCLSRSNLVYVQQPHKNTPPHLMLYCVHTYISQITKCFSIWYWLSRSSSRLTDGLSPLDDSDKSTLTIVLQYVICHCSRFTIGGYFLL